jgi:hypothetical protein
MAYKDNEDKLKYQRSYYARSRKTRESAKRRSRVRHRELLEWYEDYKSKCQCSICAEDHIACLEFHHVNPDDKEIEIADAIKNSWSINKVLKELQKCIVLCSNCHKKLHWNARRV